MQAVGDRWQAEIKHQKRRIPLGFYNTADEAGFAYDKAALELYGEKAPLNHHLEQVQAWNPPSRMLRKTNTSGYRGVTQIKRSGKWQASYRHGKKLLHLGTYDTAEDAARAYDQAVIRLKGDLATTNFPLEDL